MKLVYHFIASEQNNYPLRKLISTMQAGKSQYYAWLSNKTGSKQEPIGARVEDIFWEHKCRYGARRVHKALEQSGEKASLYRVRKAFHMRSLKAIQPRSFVPKTTNSYHSYRISPNLIKDKPFPSRINEVWVGDITYIPMTEGKWSYLSVWMDLHSRRILGWQLSDHMRESIVIDSLKKAFQMRGKLETSLIVHSDRGGQYCGNEFRLLLSRHPISQSMSDADNPYDNAFMESCFSRFKAELIQSKLYATMEAARLEIFEYIEGYYNRIRLHSSLDYHSPEFYENNIHTIHTNSQKEKRSKKEKLYSTVENPTGFPQ
jgi:transposase InsO family protein